MLIFISIFHPTVCNGPLLYDYTLIYKGSLDGTVLACVIGTILHLFLWIVIWLFLTVKQQWTFKLRVTVGRHMVRNTRSIKFVNDIDLADRDSESMMIMANGRTFSVTESGPKKLIMNTLARAAIGPLGRRRSTHSPAQWMTARGSACPLASGASRPAKGGSFN